MVYVSLRGLPGSGKSSLTRAMKDGQAHLIDVPLLRQACAAGFAEWPREAAEPVTAQGAWQYAEGQPYFVGDNVVEADHMDFAGGSVVMVGVVARPWQLEARTALRGRPVSADAPQSAREALEGLAWCENQWREIPFLWVDTSDYPARQVAQEEALHIALDEEYPAVAQRPNAYQATLLLDGEPYGNVEADCVQFARSRVEALLPASMTGMSVLDIGASEGLFVWESLRRGASYVCAVEREPVLVEFLKAMRNARRAPVTVADLDINEDVLPGLHTDDDGWARWSVALLLNVLHHSPDPAAALANVLCACESCIIETPFCQGEEPYRETRTTYPEKWCLPPQWIENEARAAGFAVTEIANSPQYPGYRLIVTLRRDDSQKVQA